MVASHHCQSPRLSLPGGITTTNPSDVGREGPQGTGRAEEVECPGSSSPWCYDAKPTWGPMRPPEGGHMRSSFDVAGKSGQASSTSAASVSIPAGYRLHWSPSAGICAGQGVVSLRQQAVVTENEAGLAGRSASETLATVSATLEPVRR
jgi:hypothetical protein